LRRFGVIKDVLWYLLAVVLLSIGAGLFARYMDSRLILGAISALIGIVILIWNTIKN